MLVVLAAQNRPSASDFHAKKLVKPLKLAAKKRSSQLQKILKKLDEVAREEMQMTKEDIKVEFVEDVVSSADGSSSSSDESD